MSLSRRNFLFGTAAVLAVPALPKTYTFPNVPVFPIDPPSLSIVPPTKEWVIKYKYSIGAQELSSSVDQLNLVIPEDMKCELEKVADRILLDEIKDSDLESAMGVTMNDAIQDLKDLTDHLPLETRAEILCELNSWRFHPIIAKLQPEGYGELNMARAHLVIHPLVEHLKAGVGEKEYSRRWNVSHTKRMTNAQFEEWWEKEGQFPMTELQREKVSRIAKTMKQMDLKPGQEVPTTHVVALTSTPQDNPQ